MFHVLLLYIYEVPASILGSEAAKIDSFFVVLLIPHPIYHSKPSSHLDATQRTRMYPKVSGLAAWSENCKWYSSLPLGAVVSLFYESA
jgi:hypothetical protein